MFVQASPQEMIADSLRVASFPQSAVMKLVCIAEDAALWTNVPAFIYTMRSSPVIVLRPFPVVEVDRSVCPRRLYVAFFFFFGTFTRGLRLLCLRFAAGFFAGFGFEVLALAFSASFFTGFFLAFFAGGMMVASGGQRLERRQGAGRRAGEPPRSAARPSVR